MELAPNSKCTDKMLPFKREAVALVVFAFYFLVLDQQTQESRLQQLLLLQHLKRSRRKRLILLEISLCKTRRVRHAWSWPRNQFWFETRSIKQKFCWRMVEGKLLRRPKPNVEPALENVIEWDWRNPDTTRCEILCDRKRMYLSSKPWLPTLTMPAHRVNRTFTLVNFLLSWVVFTRVSVGVYTRKIFT